MQNDHEYAVAEAALAKSLSTEKPVVTCLLDFSKPETGSIVFALFLSETQ